MNGPSVFVAVVTTLLLVSRKMKDILVGTAPGLTIAIEVTKAAGGDSVRPGVVG